MTEISIFRILMVVSVLSILTSWYQTIRYFRGRYLLINLFIGFLLLISIIALKRSDYWFWLPGILMGGVIVPGLILTIIILSTDPDPYEDG